MDFCDGGFEGGVDVHFKLMVWELMVDGGEGESVRYQVSGIRWGNVILLCQKHDGGQVRDS